MAAARQNSARNSGSKKPPPPLSEERLRAIAIRYVERYQTTRQRLRRLLQRKVRERGWEEGLPPPDFDGLIEQMAGLGYVNDAAFAEARMRSLARRGLGRARIAADLAAAGIDRDSREALLESADPWRAALDFARRKRFGPFGAAIADPRQRQRQLAAFARAGHPQRLAVRILDAESAGDLIGDLTEEADD